MIHQSQRNRSSRSSLKRISILLGILLVFPAWGQLGASPPTAQPETPKDPLGRNTPRGTVLGFLAATRKGDNELAVQYLNTRLRGQRAADLAHRLFVVLDRRLPARLNALTDKPEGSLSDALDADQELVGTIDSENRKVDIIVERVDRADAGAVWLFSSETLDSVPDLYDESNVVSVDNVLPEVLVNTRFAGIVLFEWLAVFVGIPLFYAFAALLNRLLSQSVSALRRRYYGEPDLPGLEVLPIPVRLLLQALVIRWLLARLGLPLLARQFWSGLATIITIAGCVWLVILLNDWGEAYIRRRLRGRNLTGTISMLRLARRVADALIVFVGLLVTLYQFGVNPTAALAGLGVGGIAVALAAQKTLENVIGGVSLIFDRAMDVGDSVKVDDTSGTVVDIGLRSTRIRTLDRTVVSVPNGRIATMRLENVSVRDKFWFHPTLNLRHGTTALQVHAVLEDIRTLLADNREVEPDSVRVRFLHFGPSSLDVEVFAYVSARDTNHFLAIQETLLLRIMQSIESAGVQIALPSQALFLAGASISTEAGAEGALQAATLNKKTSDPATAKSA